MTDIDPVIATIKRHNQAIINAWLKKGGTIGRLSPTEYADIVTDICYNAFLTHFNFHGSQEYLRRLIVTILWYRRGDPSFQLQLPRRNHNTSYYEDTVLAPNTHILDRLCRHIEEEEVQAGVNRYSAVRIEYADLCIILTSNTIRMKLNNNDEIDIGDDATNDDLAGDGDGDDA